MARRVSKGSITVDFMADIALDQLDFFKRSVYQNGVKKGIAKYMSLIRLTAADQIMDNRTGLPDFMDYKLSWMKRKLQPVHPVKLTSRSGRLKRGLLEGGRSIDIQNIDKRQSKTDPTVFKTLSGVITGGGQRKSKSAPMEYFTGRWSSYVREGSAMLDKWRQMFKPRKGGGQSGSLEKAKKLANIRFRHETGLRGTSRPFFFPAYLKTRNRLNEYIVEEINKGRW